MYLNYCRALQFDEAPDYVYLRQLFRLLFRTMNFQYDYVYDWTVLKQQKNSTNTLSHSRHEATETPSADRHRKSKKSKGKGRPYSITERRVPELIPVLGSQT